MTIGIILSLFSFYLNSQIIPNAHFQQKNIRRTLGMENPDALLEPGVFITDFPGYTLFIHRVHDNQFYNITIWQPGPQGGPTRTTIAKQGEFARSPDGKKLVLKLMNGTADEVDMQNPNNFYKLNFQTSFVTLDLSSASEKLQKKPKSMTIKELQDKIRAMEPLLKNTEIYPLYTEIYKRITWSFSPLIFILLGFPLAIITNHREKSANMIVAVLCATAYYVLTLGAQGLSMEGKIPPEIIMWVPNIVGLLFIIILNRKICASQTVILQNLFLSTLPEFSSFFPCCSSWSIPPLTSMTTSARAFQ